jgi:hypothetical protein
MLNSQGLTAAAILSKIRGTVEPLSIAVLVAVRPGALVKNLHPLIIGAT